MNDFKNWLDNKVNLVEAAERFAEASKSNPSKYLPRFHRLLTTWGYLTTKLSKIGLQALLNDYNLPRKHKIQLDAEKENSFRLIQKAIQMSALILEQDKTQLASQLLGRLLFCEAPDIQKMLKDALEWEKAPWLRPSIASLTPPGTLEYNLPDQGNVINAVIYIPDSNQLICGCGDGKLKVWDIEKIQFVCEYFEKDAEPFHSINGFVSAIAVTKDGKRVLSGLQSENYPNLKLWDLSTGKVLRTFNGHRKWVMAVTILRDGKRVISASADKTLKVWDLETGEILRTLTGHTELVKAVAELPDGRVISGSFDGTLKIWDLEGKTKTRTLKVGNYNPVLTIAALSDRPWVISASDNILTLWDWKQGKVLRTLQGHTRDIWAVAAVPEKNLAVSASDDDTLKVWNLETGECLRTLRGHCSMVKAVAVIPEKRDESGSLIAKSRIISGSFDLMLKVWDLEGEETLSTQTPSTLVNSVSVVLDGEQGVFNSSACAVKIWYLKKTAEPVHLPKFIDRIWALIEKPERQLSIVVFKPTRQLKSLNYWEKLFYLSKQAFRRFRNRLGISLKQKKAVYTPDDSPVIIWDLRQGKELHRLKITDQEVSAVAVTPDGQQAILGTTDGILRVWDLDTGIVAYTLGEHSSKPKKVTAIAITSNGDRAISGSEDGTLELWDLKNRKKLDTQTDHSNNIVTEIVFTKNGERAIIASLGLCNNLKVWNLKNAEKLYFFNDSSCERPRFDRTAAVPHNDSVVGVVVTKDGQHVISASRDRTLKVWDLNSRKSIAKFYGDAPFEACTIASDETIVAIDSMNQGHFLHLERCTTER